VEGALTSFENSFDILAIQDWFKGNSHIPIGIAICYVAFVFFGPRLMKNQRPLRLKPLFASWNLLLSLFSVVGALRLIPALAASALFDPTRGLGYTMCAAPLQWVKQPEAVWVGLFVMSKVPELLDTVFLVARKKPVIFLHWYHHTTVMLFCWHSLATMSAPGIWFASMNFFVHSVMYGYYFATNVGLYRYVRPVAPVITTLQILQMVGGTLIVLKCAWEKAVVGSVCHIDSTNLVMGLGMYLSYFTLFALFFAKKYLFCGPAAASMEGGSGKGAISNLAQSQPLLKKQQQQQQQYEFSDGHKVSVVEERG